MSEVGWVYWLRGLFAVCVFGPVELRIGLFGDGASFALDLVC